MTAVAAASLALAALVGGTLWLVGGLAAVGYAVLYAVAVAVPGVPLGSALFGRRHPAAWISGALLGYGLLQIVIWLAIESRAASPWAVAVGWAVLSAATWLARRYSGPDPIVRLPEWSAPDSRALLLVLALVPVLMGPPYFNLGRADVEGTRYYRAYFTADFLWHSALAFELGHVTLPPRNPYLAPRTMNYYWTYFLLPSATARWSSAATPDATTVQSVLKSNAILTGLLMVGILFIVARLGVPRAGAAALGVTLAIVAASAEGFYAIADLVKTGRPFGVLLDTNIDAVVAWQFNGMRIDNVPRSLWYTPQHTTAVALGLVGWLVALGAGARASLTAILGAGLALGLATTMNPLLGGCFALVYGVTMAIEGIVVARDWRLVARHALAAGPVLLAVGWSSLGRMTEGAGAALAVTLPRMTAGAVVATLLLGLGPVLAPALAGLFRRTVHSYLPAILASAALLLGVVLLYFVRISESSWVGFRAGQILLVAIALLLARAFSTLGRRGAAALAAVILVLGLPTTAIDTWNASDIGNDREGPGFKWTLTTTADQERVFAWIRRQTPETAIVQMEPIVRAREHWTLVPSFAGRRMAAGQPISLLPKPEYLEASERVKTIYATGNAEEASQIARRMRIDYLYVDATDTAAYPNGVRKFDEQPALFSRAFSSGDARVYRVH